MKATQQLIFIIILFALFNCSHPVTDQKLQKLDDGRPTWTSYRSGAYKQETLVFYGVGTAKDIPNKVLLRITSSNRAEANLVHVLEIFIGKIRNAYMTALEQKKNGASVKWQHVGPIFRNMLNVVDRKKIQQELFWIDPSDGTGYALASFKLEDFLKRFATKQEFSSEFQTFVIKHAEQIFLEMANE